MDERRPPSDRPESSRGAPTIRDVARARRRLDRHRLQGAERRRPAAPGDARQGACASPREIGYRPNDLAQSLHRATLAHHRHHLQRQLRPLHHPDRRGAGGAAGRRGHRRLHVQRHRRPGARAPAPRPAARQAHRRAGGHRAPRRQAAADRPVRPRPAGRLRLLPGRRSRTRSACCRTTRAARCSRSSIWPASAAGASPTSPGRSISRRCACADAATGRRSPRPGCRELPGFYLPGVWSEAWGREAVARLFDGGRAAGRALLRQRPDRPRRGRRAARARPRRARATSPSSASTTGT